MHYPTTQPLHPLLPISDEAQLLARCRAIEGLTFWQLAQHLNLVIPTQAARRKGWAGKAIEMALGADAGNDSVPDFQQVGIELKTIPFNHHGAPLESTFVTHIPLLTIHQQSWKTSNCYAKLQRVLWVPVEGDRSIPYLERRIGHALLWSPTYEQEAILARDWEELTGMIVLGQLAAIHAGIGEYLQIRPKAMHGKSLSAAYDTEGGLIQTLPRGFYLRRSFTTSLLRLP